MVLKLREIAPDDNWANAKCLSITVNEEHDPFFSEDEEELQEALDFCNGEADGIVCPIRHECLIFALTNNERFGIWGGSSEITRRAIRKKHPPLRGNKANPEWEWKTEEEALQGLKKEELLAEDEEE